MVASWKTSLQIAVILLIFGLGVSAAALVFPYSGVDQAFNQLFRGGVPPMFSGDDQITATFHGGIVFAALVGLICLSLLGIALGEIRLPPVELSKPTIEQDQAKALAEATGLKLELEIRSLIDLLRSYLAANNTYSASLSKAQKDLLASVSPEDIKIIVKYLLIENEKMEAKTSNLEQSLKRSHSQIEEMRHTLNEAQELGLRDPLTALCNRRYFDEALSREIKESGLVGTELSLILADIDHFKSINDKFGHLVGDEVLKLFGKLLANNVKGRDTVARFGGEEFAIILPHTNIDNATNIAEQIRVQLEGNRWVLKNTKKWIGKITASFGVAELATHDNAEKLIQRADERLYEAKSNGRNRVVAENHSDLQVTSMSELTAI